MQETKRKPKYTGDMVNKQRDQYISVLNSAASCGLGGKYIKNVLRTMKNFL